MKIFIDTSALVKYYLNEEGSLETENFLKEVKTIVISGVTRLEGYSVFRRMLTEKVLDKKSYQQTIKEFETDLEYFELHKFNEHVEKNAIQLIAKHQLKPLDAIQLGSCIEVKDEIDKFMCCDKKLLKAAKSEGLKVINPMD